ncbi:MAG: cytochrome c biogenesis protein ResB [Ectothiorhodospiraceae bacterium]|nr:cytochrome c biogenesis protein ResB [Ectothiorhodospiraceae bacterium]MCH8503159.1 cytochrome c biogenesis protein ResB [Ectothiorhodospiraceae bacterium]
MSSVNHDALTAGTTPRRTRVRYHPLLAFLGSMNLAITLLVAVGLASVIGTVLQQNQPYQDYLIKLGPFWFEVFHALGLYDVYTAPWFLLLVGSLVTATCVCLLRHTPTVLQEMRQFRLHQQARSLRALSQHGEWTSTLPPEAFADRVTSVLRRLGYRVRIKRHGQALLVAGLAGASNRLGYVFTHLAIVLICIGGVADSNLLLKLQAWTGQVQAETRLRPLAEMPARSRLPAAGGAFRGSITIPEGDRANAVLLPLGEGFVLRDLPFELRLLAFRVERYASGEPRAYESDVALFAPGMEEPLQATVGVNRPLSHGGYTIYQASFTDGGSALALTAWPLRGDGNDPFAFDGQVFEPQGLRLGDARYTLEFTHFESHNIQPGVGDIGPSLSYLLRNADGQALEFENTMYPVDMDDGRYFLSGVRGSRGEPFRYLHIPADHRDSPGRFHALLTVLRGDAAELAVARGVGVLLEELGMQDPRLRRQLELTGHELLARVPTQGYRAASAFRTADGASGLLHELPAHLLDAVLEQAYRLALEENGENPQRRLTTEDAAFLQHSVATLPALQRYGAPVFLQLNGFQQKQASGFEITRTPGKPVVYTGFLMLVAGIYLMFFVRYRRIWCWLESNDDGSSRVLLAGQSPRDRLGFEQHFGLLQRNLANRRLD